MFRVLGAILFLMLVAAGLLAWRLSDGPLPLDPLTPYIEDALHDPEQEFRLSIGRTLLTWEGGDRELDLRAADVRAIGADGAVLAAVPEIGISISPLSLVRGELLVSAVEVIGPRIHLRRDTQGAVHFGLWQTGATDSADAAGSDVVVEALVRGLGEESSGPAAVLAAVRVINAEARIVDEALGVTWQVPRASVELLRGMAGRIDLSAALEVALPEGTTRLDLAGGIDLTRSGVDVDASFSGLRPAALAGFSTALEPLAALDLPLAGTVSLSLVAAPRVVLENVAVALTGGAGTLRLPEPLSAEYAIGGLSLRGSASALTDTVLLEALEIALVPPPGVEAPGPSTATVSGTLGRGSDGRMAGEVTAAVRNIPVDALPQWWPVAVAPNPRGWVTEQLAGGAMLRGEWVAALAGDSLETLDVTGLSGAARVEGVTVDYLPPMPKATQAKADMTFALDTITLTIDGGQVAGLGGAPLKVTGGLIAFHDLDKEDNSAVINLGIEGGLPQALKLIDSKPLGYTSTLGLSPKGAEGTVRTDLKLAFPLLADLPLDLLKVEAKAEVTDAFLPKAVFGQDLGAGNLTLAVDTSALEARGQATIGGVPAGFVWREIFSGKPYRSHYVAQAVVPEDKRGVFGLDFPPFTAPYLTGPVRADVELTVVDKTLSTLGAQVDLRDAGMSIPGFEWTKAPGVPAQATVSVRMAGPRVLEVPTFVVRASDGSAGPLVAEGRVALHKDAALDRIEFSRLRLGETAMAGAVTVLKDGTWDIDVHGPAFDATPFISGGPRGPDVHPEQALEEDDGEGEDLPPLRIRGAFDVVWLAEDGTMETVRVDLDRRDERWRHASLDGLLEGKTPFSYRLAADPADASGLRRRFSASTDDAGALLRSLDLLGTVRGGRLEAAGDVDAAGLATGRLTIADYRLVDAPVLAKLLSVAALTGIVDALTGEGISFQTLEAPFTYGDDLLTVKDFRTHGPSLGLTGDGTIDLGRDEIALSGTLVPAYAVNSLLGKLPLVGGLLTGFEKDGGLFAASYSVRGPTGAPDISVNPLAALAPGFLRNIFGLMSPSAAPAAPAPAPAAGEAPAPSAGE
ncbi:AsmA-like C-terminal domain-containing protein [Novispirillum sp. DQ9]|uniref:DUF3971 domain-containing protein n=1 Tax=Novispirillum sp. DQ9 TaxID=3398612 RepID=UPI003C7C7A69